MTKPIRTYSFIHPKKQRPVASATGLINFLSITDHSELDHVIGIIKIAFRKR